jgi:hypothetical protein
VVINGATGSSLSLGRNRLALSEDGGSDPHECSTLFDRNAKVIAHSHRQLTATFAECSLHLQIIPKFAQSTKEGSSLFCFIKEWRESHQAYQSQPFALANSSDHFRQLIFTRACLGRLVGEIYLDEDRQFSSPNVIANPVQPASQRNRIQRVNEIEELDRSPCFISLKMSDQMPAGRITAKLGNLSIGFLYAILPQIYQAGPNRELQNFRRMGLGDRYQCHVRRFTARRPRATIDSSTHVGHSFAHVG